jgi:3-methyladenine DNA glycosylase Tag
MLLEFDPMTNFESILKTALERAGGETALSRRLPQVKSAAELRAIADDRYFSEMSRRIFRAGLKHSLVDGKWPAFEEVFLGFDPRRVRAMPDEALEALLGDTRIIRHWGKLKATHANAAAMCEVIEEHGGCGAYLAGWEGVRIVELWDDIAKRFSQMGGASAAYFLRMVGRDTFTLSPYVARSLVASGALAAEPKGKKGRQAAQEVFNAWAEETGRPLAELSMILAIATD